MPDLMEALRRERRAGRAAAEQRKKTRSEARDGEKGAAKVRRVTLDEALDELYGADLDGSSTERTGSRASWREPATAGRGHAREAAKPTVAAWALNQLARQHRRDVDLLLDAGHRLREAQAGVLGGREEQTFEQARERRNATRCSG